MGAVRNQLALPAAVREGQEAVTLGTGMQKTWKGPTELKGGIVVRHLANLLVASSLCLAALSGAASAQKIGVSIAHFDETYLVLLMNAMRGQIEARAVQAQFEDAHGDVERQLSQVQNFIAQKVDAVIVNAVDSEATSRIT
jgi:ABC-type sugar transport system substrate-binding protein